MESFKYHIDLYKKIYSDLSKNNRLSLNNKGVIVRDIEQIKKLFNLKHSDIKNIGEKGYFFHPCPISHAVLGYYDLYLETQDLKYKKLLLNQIYWLEDNAVEYKDAIVYPFPFKIKSFSDHDNWVSGMYQGQILSAFIRAYIITKDSKYLDFSEKVYNSFKFKLGDKFGFMVEDKYGLWYEEAPIKPAKHILNGFIFAIWGIYDYYILTGDIDLKIILDKTVETLVNTIELYDTGYWSYYDLSGNIASYKYHNDVHIPQLFAMYNITKINKFNEIALKWERYSTSKYSLIRKKIKSVILKLKENNV